MNITFLGAARMVTGSCYLIETENTKFLVDCGMFQGGTKEELMNFEVFPFDIKELDFMILTHAHIDHCGRIPKLYKDGFRGEIYSTKATADLCSIMLVDSAHIQESDMNQLNRKRVRAGKKELTPLYYEDDAYNCLAQFETLEYGEFKTINDDLNFCLKDAGHMLGSAFIEVIYKGKKIVFSGDIGNDNMPILNDPENSINADTLIMESTYGNRNHATLESQSNEFINIILNTIRRGGNVIIPSFAVGRTQELIYELNKFIEVPAIRDELKKVPVFVDSPLAVNATKIFEENKECYDDEMLSYLLKGDNPLYFDNLHLVQTVEESKAINEDSIPKIIISASGMCDVGRIKHHLKHNLYKPNSTILFVGYQANGTLGKRIVSGEKIVKIFGEEISVNAEIKYLDGFSGHADQKGLLKWIENIKNKPKQIFLVHGEIDSQQELKSLIEEKFKIKTAIPHMYDTYSVEGTLEKNKASYHSSRLEVLENLNMIKDDVSRAIEYVDSELKYNLTIDEINELKNQLDELKSCIKKIKD